MGNRERLEHKPNYGEILLPSNRRYPEKEQWTNCFIVRIQVIGISLIRMKRDLPSFCRLLQVLSPMQTDATLLANNSQHCWMLHVASVCTPYCMLLRRVSKRSNFCTALPTLLGPRTRSTHGLLLDYKVLWVVFFPWCTAGLNIVGSCCFSLHTTANTDATSPNIVCPAMLGIVASVCP